YLSISQSEVSDAGVERALRLPCFARVLFLGLFGAPVTTGVMPALLRPKDTLGTLTFYGPRITGEGWKRLRDFRQGALVKLNIANGPLSDTDLRVVSELQQLTLLGLGGTQITDAGLARLDGMRHLQELDLKGTGITDAGLEELQVLKRLK